jgi:hypothetical protein
MDCEFTRSCEDSVRRAPLAALGISTVVGLVVSKLPLVAITGALLRLAFALLRPVLLVFGILKLVECCRKNNGASYGSSLRKPAKPRFPDQR